MTTKPLKKFTELLKRNEGISLTPIIVIMVIMSVMGGVFTSIMGGWKVSAPITINSSEAFYQAEAAAMFALQDAQYRFYSKDTGGNDLFNFGDRTTPFPVFTSSTGAADYWFERPAIDNPALYTDDDDRSDDDDDTVDDDDDDITNPTRYTITATGRAMAGTTTLAKRQIKILADIIPNTLVPNPIVTGVQTSGAIWGTSGVGFGMNNLSSTATVTYDDITTNSVSSGSESGPPAIVYRPAQPVLLAERTLFEDIVKALATDQGHFNSASLTIGAGNDDYPEPATQSYYYDFGTNTMPNFTYVGQNLTVNTPYKAHGVIWVKGNVLLDNTGTMNAIIICEGDITFFGPLSNIDGGIIHYGAFINGNVNTNAIMVNNLYFNALNATIPDITVASWQETVSAN